MSGEDVLDIVIAIVMFISACLLIYLATWCQKFMTFIRDEKLQKKYQEWKKDNKGLI